MYIHTYIHTYIRTYIHTYIHTHAHTHTHRAPCGIEWMVYVLICHVCMMYINRWMHR